MIVSKCMAALAFALFLAADAAPPSIPKHPEAKLYSPTANAQSDVDAALAKAKASNGMKNVVLVMGGNWCHDSRALAGWFDTPRFKAMMQSRYELVFVDVGIPQTGQGRNLEIVRRYGFKKIKGTPLVLILSADGAVLNKKRCSTLAQCRKPCRRLHLHLFQQFWRAPWLNRV